LHAVLKKDNIRRFGDSEWDYTIGASLKAVDAVKVSFGREKSQKSVVDTRKIISKEEFRGLWL